MLSKKMIYALLLLCFGGLVSCAAQQIQPDFYQGLVCRADLRSAENADGESADGARARKDAAAFFERALNSSNVFIRQAAAAELGSLLFEGETLAAPVLERVRQEASGSWAAAFEALSDGSAGADPARVREKALAFILSSGDYGGAAANPGGQFPDEAALYALGECRSRDANFFSPAENAAIDGHIAASRSRFSEALFFFRIAADEDPQLFVRYPALLNDLGRCFQYAAIGTEGIYLFLDWEKNLTGRGDTENPPPGGISGVRFRLLFFAARIARQRNLMDQGIELFARALAVAPDSEQADACIWYILDSAMSRGSAAAIQHLAAFVPQWHDDAYFFDVLDKLSRELTLRRQWKDLITVFSLLHSRSGDAGQAKSAAGASTAKYAYIIGRALAEGYLSPDEIRLAAEAVGADAATNRAALSFAWLRVAYETGSASFYYRAQSAAALGEPFLAPPQSPARSAGSGLSAADSRQSAAMEFLLGFFSNKAAGFAPRYIRLFEKELNTENARTLAAALGEAGLYAESMRLVSLYASRSGAAPVPDRRDLELWYPRPFQELVEQYAGETGIAPELLFGLIRTESAFQSDIVSRAGAVGLTQLMPATADEMAGRIRRQGGPNYAQAESDSSLNLRDPSANIHIGAVYFEYLLERMKDLHLALLAYNGGMNRVRRWRDADSRVTPGGLAVDIFLETIEYPETREYGRKVLAAAAMYRELYYNHNG